MTDVAYLAAGVRGQHGEGSYDLGGCANHPEYFMQTRFTSIVATFAVTVSGRRTA